MLGKPQRELDQVAHRKTPGCAQDLVPVDLPRRQAIDVHQVGQTEMGPRRALEGRVQAHQHQGVLRAQHETPQGRIEDLLPPEVLDLALQRGALLEHGRIPIRRSLEEAGVKLHQDAQRGVVQLVFAVPPALGQDLSPLPLGQVPGNQTAPGVPDMAPETETVALEAQAHLDGLHDPAGGDQQVEVVHGPQAGEVQRQPLEHQAVDAPGLQCRPDAPQLALEGQVGTGHRQDFPPGQAGELARVSVGHPQAL